MSPSPSLTAPYSVRTSIDAQTARATGAFMRRIRDHFPVSEAYLFGSRAGQTHTPDSDADVAVVLKGKRDHRFAVVQGMAAIAFDVMLETGVNVQALPLWEEDLKHPDVYINPALLKNILRGVRL